MLRRAVLAAFGMLVMAFASGGAAYAQYPDKPIKLVIPYRAGGGSDSLARVLQAVIPHEIQGRVFTLVMASSIAVSPIGLAIAGPVAELIGIRAWFVIAGIAILLGASLGFMVPGLKDLEKAFGGESQER